MSGSPNSGYYHHRAGTLSRGAVLDVGLKCTHSCRFCYYSYLDGTSDQFKGMRTAKFRSLSECKQILQLLKRNGFINFDYTGGEPCLHPDIVEMTRYAHQELGLKGRIITLGQWLTEKRGSSGGKKLIADLLEAGVTNFLFSLHAANEELFARTTGEKYKKIYDSMCYLDEKGFQYTTNTTVYEWNYKHLPELAHEITRHGIYLHNFIIMNAYYAWNVDGKAFGVQARYSDIHPYLMEAVDILESDHIGVNIRYAPLCAVKGKERNLVGMVGVRYDPYEWMNLAGHMGGTPEYCASVIPLREGEIETHLTYKAVDATIGTGVKVSGVRGDLKCFCEKCSRCGARDVCDGIDPNYLRIYGPDEFSPYDQVEKAPMQSERYQYPAPFFVKTDQYTDMKSVITAAFKGMPPKLGPKAEEIRRAADPVTISVIIPCYNYGKYLADAVESVIFQTYRNFEIIIVNDGSTDNTETVAKDLIRSHPDCRIKLINQPNSGQPAISRNKGISQARGEFILCLDADDKIAPTMLAECLHALENNPTAAVSYTDRLDFDGVDQVVKARTYDFEILKYANHISYCALFRRKAWEDVGGYRTNVKGCEDWDFWIAAGARGYTGHYMPVPLFLYRRHDTGIYQDVIQNFPNIFAQIILNNSEIYKQTEISSARNHLRLVIESKKDAGPVVSEAVPIAQTHEVGGPFTQKHASTASESGGDSTRKLLSICMVGRNDDYGGNFRYRLGTALNHMAKNIGELNLFGLIEVVVTDWNSEHKLGDALTLSPEARQLVRFVYVPPEIAKPLNRADKDFNINLACNVAMRRAEGRFIMCMGGDILFSQASLKNLMDLLQGKTKAPIDIDRSLLLIHRKFIPWQFVANEPGIEALDDFLFYNSWKFRIEIFDSGLNSGMGAFLMNRRILHECRGVDEGLGKWGWSDIELGLRINQRYPSAVLTHLGIYSYELDVKTESRTQNSQDSNPQVISKSFESNTPDWGMANIELEIYVPAERCSPETAKDGKRITKAELFRDMLHSPVKLLMVESLGEEIQNNPAWPSMFMLAWYTHVFKPQTFVDYSFLSGYPSIVVPLINPCITCIGIDGLENPSSAKNLVPMIGLLCGRLGFQGRIHVLSGDINSSFKRLSESAKLYDKYDLIHFVPDLFPDTYISQLEHMIRYTSEGGALIITASRPDYLQEISNYLNHRFKECLFIKSNTHRVGIIIRYEEECRVTDRTSSFDEYTEGTLMESILTRSMN